MLFGASPSLEWSRLVRTLLVLFGGLGVLKGTLCWDLMLAINEGPATKTSVEPANAKQTVKSEMRRGLPESWGFFLFQCLEHAELCLLVLGRAP